MRLEQLTFEGVRNLASATVELSPDSNLFYGPNGAGKSAVLEAVSLLLTGRSFRTVSVRSVIDHDVDALLVRGVLTDTRRGRISVGISKNRANQTELKLDGRPARQMSTVAALLPVQIMLPDMAGLVFGSPRGRRQLLDQGLFHVKPDYLFGLQAYRQALEQRNAQLKRRGAAPGEMKVWLDQLAATGERVAHWRRDYVAALGSAFGTVLTQLAPELSVTLDLDDGWPSGMSLQERLSQSATSDVKYGVTQSGPHRCDLLVVSAGRRAAEIASRGQGKMIAIALKLAQAQLLRQARDQDTLFLIDDAGSELDDVHNRRVQQILASMGAQIMATSTRPDWGERPLQSRTDPGEERRLFHVEQGRVERDPRA